jgi:co-chaperonin GroES (HSP10)
MSFSDSIPKTECRGDAILVRPVQAPGERKVGSIVLPGMANSVDGVLRALVYSKGEGVERCQVGDVVVLADGPAHPVLDADGKQYLILNGGTILAIDRSWTTEEAHELAEGFKPPERPKVEVMQATPIARAKGRRGIQ